MPRQPARRGAAAPDGWERRRNILLNEYERVALELFAARGYHQVTVDDIAQAAGVTTRTLFRYFPSKQEVLLGFPRRGLAVEIEMIDAMEPADDPLSSAWAALREFVSGSPVEPAVVGLWDAATEGAPEVTARVRGERIDAIFQAYVRYGERCYGVDQAEDPRPRWLAGILAGIELAVVESVAQAPGVVDELVTAVTEGVEVLADTRLRLPRKRSRLSLTD
jgi:AcrR family transcriptional regulator